MTSVCHWNGRHTKNSRTGTACFSSGAHRQSTLFEQMWALSPIPAVKMPLPSQKAMKGKKTDVRRVWKEPERSKWITCWGKKQHRYLYHVGRDEGTHSTSYQSGKRAHRAIPQPIWRLCAFCTHTFFNLSSWEHTGFNESAVWSTPLMTVHTEHYAVYRVKTKLLQMVNSSILHTVKSKE